MKNFETKSPLERIEIVANKEKEEEKPRRDKSDFFYKDKWFKQREFEEKIKRDPDFRAYMNR